MEDKNIRKGNSNLHLIVGQAGSGKSTLVYEKIRSGEISRPLILCSKWMLVRATEERLKKLNINCQVKTIQSITANVEDFRDNLVGVDSIIVEEFSQIDYTLLLSLVDKVEQVGITDIYAVGDILQNRPVSDSKDEYSPIRYIIRTYMLGKVSNFFAGMTRNSVYQMMKDDGVRKLEVPVELQTIFSSIDVIVLTENWRNGKGKVIRTFEDIEMEILRNANQSRNQYFNKIYSAALRDDWQIIVADWKQMNTVNYIVEKYYDENNVKIDSDIYYDIRGIEDVAHRKYYRKVGDEFVIINGKIQGYVKKEYVMNYLRKTFALVSDSIQGMEFENVLIVSLLEEDLYKDKKRSWSYFQFNSLYTAMTRHRNNVDIAADPLGIRDLMIALNKLPKARKEKMSEEWLMYCVMKAPNCEIAWKEYERHSHFRKMENGDIYTIIGQTIVNENGMKIQFNPGVKKEIKLVEKITFANMWEKYRQPDSFSSEIRKKSYSDVRKGKRKSALQMWISEMNDDELNELKEDASSLSARKFKEKWSKTQTSVVKNLKEIE